jgi:hypothetical protein
LDGVIANKSMINIIKVYEHWERSREIILGDKGGIRYSFEQNNSFLSSICNYLISKALI